MAVMNGRSGGRSARAMSVKASSLRLRVSPHRRPSLKRSVTLRASSDAAEAKQEPPLNIGFELGNLLLRTTTSTLMLHNGIEKLSDPAGTHTHIYIAKNEMSVYVHVHR